MFRHPAIQSDERIAGWKKVTRAVHAAGGRIFIQLWHVGRISHPSFQPGGALPVAPSAIKPETQAFTANGFEPIPTPRALDASQIPGIVASYYRATKNALAAGWSILSLRRRHACRRTDIAADGQNDIRDSDPQPLFNYVGRKLSDKVSPICT